MTQESSQILSRAAAPRSATGDTGGATAHSLPDQIEAAKFDAAAGAMGAGLGGIRRVPLRVGNPAGLRFDRRGNFWT